MLCHGAGTYFFVFCVESWCTIAYCQKWGSGCRVPDFIFCAKRVFWWRCFEGHWCV